MRAKEFLRLILESVDTQTKSDLDIIAQAADSDAGIAKKAKLGLASILAFAKRALGVSPAEQPVQEDPMTDSTINELENLIEQLKGQPAVVKQIKSQIDKLRNEIVNAERVSSQQGYDQGVSSVFDVNKASVEIKQLLDQVTQVPSNLRELVKRALVVYITENNDTFDTVKQFISQCATPERYFNLPELIESEASSSFTTDPEIVPIAKLLAGVVPVGKRSATGKGEILMMLMGAGASEPPVGDLQVDLGGKEVMVEVKASEGTTDWTLASGAMNVEAARTVLVNTINKFTGRTVFLDAPAKTKKDGVTGISGIGRDTLPILNPIFQQMGAAATREMFRKMVVAVMGKEVEALLPALLESITDKGMDPALMLPALKQFQFDWYKSKNKHYALITLNTISLSFSIAKTSEKFVQDTSIGATKIFDFRPNPGAIITFKQK